MGVCSDLFYTSDSEDDTLYRKVVPSDEQLEYLQTNWNELADYLKPLVSQNFGMPANTWIQGSYKYGTLIRPVFKGLEYDVDLGIYLLPNEEQLQKLPSSKVYRSYIRSLLEIYAASDDEAENVATPSKEKCERIHYKKDFHIDIPAYKLVARKHLLALQPNDWEESDPRMLYLWFKRVCENVRDASQLRRLIQYIKNWSMQKFKDEESDCQPSSIMLTVLVCNAYIILNQYISKDDDEAFATIIQKILSKMNTSVAIPNPADSAEDLNRLSYDGNQGFLRALQELKEICERACNTNSQFQSSILWSKVFGHFFPIAAEKYSTENAVSRVAPDIEIERLSTKHGTPELKVRGSIMSVPKGKWLKFRITNAAALPLGCTVEWVVRNAGKEAMDTNDLGHKAVGIGLFEHTEHTAYHGTHFMDCSIYDRGGELYSFTRVPVAILGKTIEQIRQKPKPQYTQFRK